MYVLRIKDEIMQNKIIEAMSDHYSRIILEATRDHPKSAMEINSDYKIPISTTYRRLQMLCDAGFLTICGTISSDGKKFFMYKSKIKQIMTKIDGNKVEIEITQN